ncbi:hypothetical protein [Adhaeribacter rhizoryzae]|uniref:STAS/SEC14 domain-containing protein n=1 Tax=Adhaeribacter rhizoryzae TaxID=2607907 RepID=A0A5M6DR78_9BACT|nr:hypothetical protein [Adhaeribacter rhizoryzae]KAA5548759.1 hypothetical protein F0145_04405 [Adhaeribacter rhizoryzae]
MLNTETTILLENPTQELELETCSVLIYRRLSFMQVLWKASISPKEYRANILQVLQIVKKLKIKYLLSDAHQLALVNNNEWFLEVCGPILTKSGIEKLARIVPYNPTSITQSKKLLEVIELRGQNKKPAFVFEAFTDLDDAFHWLEIKQPGFSGNY